MVSVVSTRDIKTERDTEEHTVKITKTQGMTLRTIAANGGEMDGYQGQKGFRTTSLAPLVKAGLLVRLGTTYTEKGGFATYNRHGITAAGTAWIAAH